MVAGAREMRRLSALVFAFAVAWCLQSGFAVAEDAIVSDVAGVWRGPWYLGMSSGVATLVVGDGAASPGTLQLTNNENFGTEPMALREGALRDGRFEFRVKGADGRILEGALPVDRLKGIMKGFGRYGGYKLLFDLTRTEAQ